MGKTMTLFLWIFLENDTVTREGRLKVSDAAKAKRLFLWRKPVETFSHLREALAKMPARETIAIWWQEKFKKRYVKLVCESCCQVPTLRLNIIQYICYKGDSASWLRCTVYLLFSTILLLNLHFQLKFAKTHLYVSDFYW